MDKSTVKALKKAITNSVKDYLEGIESFKGYNIHKVRFVEIEDRFLDFLSNGQVYSGNVFTIETILGNLDIVYINSHGMKEHNLNVNPTIVIKNLNAKYDPSIDSFEIIGLDIS